MVLQTIVLLSLSLSAQGGQRLPGQGLTGEGAKLFQQVITNPTGANGYEEYVEAAALLRTPGYLELQRFDSWVNWSDRFNRRDDQGRYVMFNPDPSGKGGSRTPIVLPPNLTFEATPLQVKQEFVRRFGGVIQIIERGNRKRVYQPRQEMSLETTLPELAQFKELAKLMMRKAEVDFAIGSTAAGTQTLLEGFKFAHNLSDGTIIHSLVGLACHGIMLIAFESVLGRLSLTDAQAVAKSCEALLHQTPMASRAILAELQNAENVLDEVLAKPALLDFTVAEETSNGLGDLIGLLDDAKKGALRSRTLELLRAKQKEVTAALGKPERDWHRSTFAELPVSRDETAWLESMSGALVNSLSPNFTQVLDSQARRRTQIRILEASARVMVFKWQFGRLPAKLEEAMTAEQIYDAGSDAPLKYEVVAPWAFQISSSGWGRTGPIRLRHSPPPSDDPIDPAKPPPPPK